MKKHLIAIALAGTFAVSANAQNVTLSGLLDHGVAHQDNGSTTFTGTRGNMASTSNLKVNVTEDLGGGLRFTGLLTQEFNITDGQHSDSSATTAADYSQPGGSSNGRATNSFQETSMALSHADWGSIKIGHFGLASRDASGVGRFGGNLGRLTSAIRTNGDAVDGAIEYTTPKLGNMVTLSIANANQAAAAASATAPTDSGFFARFDMGPLSAAVGQTKRDYGLTTGDNVETVIGAQYDAGFARFGLVRGTDNGASASSTNTSLSRLTATTGQALVPIGNGLSILAGMQKIKNTASTVDASGYTLSLRKELSKRTMVQLYTDSLDNKGTVLVSTYTTGVAGKRTSNTGVNVSHSF
jgi:hypothetical protein